MAVMVSVKVLEKNGTKMLMIVKDDNDVVKEGKRW